MEALIWRPHHPVSRAERVMRLRGLETHSCPPAGRFNTPGSGVRPVPVSAQLGGGAAHSARATAVAPGNRSSGHGVQSTRRTPGHSQAHTCSHAVRGRRRRRCIDGRAQSQVGSSWAPGSVPLDRNSVTPRSPSSARLLGTGGGRGGGGSGRSPARSAGGRRYGHRAPWPCA